MTIFEKAIEDIFNVDDLTEFCYIENIQYKCICSSLTSDVVYSGIGRLDDVNFVLSIKLPVSKMPKVGDRIKFRDKNYKISDIEIDSAKTSFSVHMESVAK